VHPVFAESVGVAVVAIQGSLSLRWVENQG